MMMMMMMSYLSSEHQAPFLNIVYAVPDTCQCLTKQYFHHRSLPIEQGAKLNQTLDSERRYALQYFKRSLQETHRINKSERTTRSPFAFLSSEANQGNSVPFGADGQQLKFLVQHVLRLSRKEAQLKIQAYKFFQK
jgi:hypothetical protein